MPPFEMKQEMMLNNNKKILLGLSVNKHQHYAPLCGNPEWELIETSDQRPEKVKEISPDILLTLFCDFFPANACIKEARRLGIPSLYIMDGIIEWRHQWENPRFGAGGRFPYNQPIIADKVACLGWQSARTLEAWGNVGKCEVVGVPRFDHYLEQPIVRHAHQGPKRLLVMTANTPGFTPKQNALVSQSLKDLEEYLQSHREWEPIWRVRKGLDKELGLEDRFPHLQGNPLREVLQESDAVLTTPSTVLLESMLAKLPTAILDYTSSPPYVKAAWSISAPQHISIVLEELINPSAKRMSFQDEILYDNLECRTPATPRLALLIDKMILIGQEARENNQLLNYPPRILPLEMGGFAFPSKYFQLNNLYPDHPVLAQKDLTNLQCELIYARQEIDNLRGQLQERKLGYWFRLSMKKLAKFLKKYRIIKFG